MGSVTDILNQKRQNSVQSTHPRETVLAATQKMNEHSIGALLVVDDEETLVGIFTDAAVWGEASRLGTLLPRFRWAM